MIERQKSKWFIKSSSQDRITFFVVFVIIAFLFVIFHLIAGDFLSIGPYGGCAFLRDTGLPCPTCGWTTAIKAFMNGRVLDAIYIQPAAATTCAIMLMTGFFSLLSACLGVNFSFLPPIRLWQIKYILVVAIIIVMGGWAVTLVRTIAKMQ